MDYFREINAFYESLETKPLKPSAIALWHAIAHICNKLGWPETFSVSMKVLSVKTGLEADTVKRARNILAQQGYITWSSRGGSACAIYTYIGLWGKFAPQSAPQPAPQSAPQPAPQSAPINKPKRKPNQNTSCAPDSLYWQSF